MSNMKIVEFKWDDQHKDWIFAPSLKDAEEFYKNLSDNDDLEDCTITDIPEEEWDEMYIIDTNSSEPDSDEVEYDEGDYMYGHKIECSFAEYAKNNSATDIIATTEY